jgi:hypothetical protein
MKRYDNASCKHHNCDCDKITVIADGRYILYSDIAPVVELINDKRQQVMDEAELIYNKRKEYDPCCFTHAFEWAVRKLMEGK